MAEDVNLSQYKNVPFDFIRQKLHIKNAKFTLTFFVEHASEQQRFAFVHGDGTATAGGREVTLSGDLLPGHTAQVQTGKTTFGS